MKKTSEEWWMTLAITDLQQLKRQKNRKSPRQLSETDESAFIAIQSLSQSAKRPENTKSVWEIQMSVWSNSENEMEISEK